MHITPPASSGGVSVSNPEKQEDITHVRATDLRHRAARRDHSLFRRHAAPARTAPPQAPAWERKNNSGRLVKKQAATVVGQTTIPASFTLHEGDFGSKAVIVLRVFRTFSVDSGLAFSVVERPTAGAILVLDRPGDAGELVHVAQNRQAADEWLSRHGYPEAELQEVTADETATDGGEGRAA